MTIPTVLLIESTWRSVVERARVHENFLKQREFSLGSGREGNWEESCDITGNLNERNYVTNLDLDGTKVTTSFTGFAKSA